MIYFFKEKMKIVFGHFSTSKLTRFTVFGLVPKNAETPVLKVNMEFKYFTSPGASEIF
jgi:hypothetical protein